MAKAVEQIKSGLTIGHFTLGRRGAVTGSIKQQVHDGDTINVSAVGNFGVRFLGIDTPEISFTLPGHGQQFLLTNKDEWNSFLVDPFAAQYQPALNLSQGLKNHLSQSFGAGVGTNHYFHALKAEQALEEEVTQDVKWWATQSQDDFQFFIAFATEVIDRYGRLLGYVNRNQPAGERPLDYNGRMLQSGLASPYFIWPNINPFRQQKSVAQAVLAPNTANILAGRESTLRDARKWVLAARQPGQAKGIFDPQNLLKLQPFELRFLAQRRVPNRWVIDLSRNDDRLIAPEEYYTVQNLEDRLYIPEEYIALFVEKGWRK